MSDELRDAVGELTTVGSFTVEFERSGCVLLLPPTGTYCVYATPDFYTPNTIAFQINDGEMEPIDGWDVPVEWTGDLDTDIALWSGAVLKATAGMENIADFIRGAVP